MSINVVIPVGFKLVVTIKSNGEVTIVLKPI